MKKILITILFSVILQYACYSQNGVTANDSLLIAQRLEEMYGSYEGYYYVVWDIINVDSSIAYQDQFGRINDPYKTLEGCYLFTSQYTFGIFKNNEIIWAYDQILPWDSPYGKISGVLDLNNDGIVEVLSEWVMPGDIYLGRELYIISWDGLSGKTINGLSEYDSDIFTHGYGDFNIADLEGDGIWEIIGYGINTEDEAVLVPMVHKWDGINYTLSEDIFNPDNYFPRNKFSAVVDCSVRKENDSLYFYNYTVLNSDSSIQYINNVDIWGEVGSNSIVVSPEKWEGIVLGGDVSWEQRSGLLPIGFTLEHKIKPGETKNTFSFRTIGLPKITFACLRGYNAPGNLVEFYGGIEDYVNNSVFIPTISAYSPPDPFIPSFFIDTLLSYVNRSSEFNWIINSVSNKYIAFLDSAKKQLEQGKLDSVSYILNMILQEINIDSSDNISPEAHALLKYNIEYLLSNLTSEQEEYNYNIKLLNSSGTLLTGGSLQYYEGNWKDAVNNGDGTFLVNTNLSQVSLRMTYEYGTQTLSNVSLANGNIAVFQTVKAEVKLQDSNGSPLDTGTVRYYAGAWRPFGTTTNGTAYKELLPNNYSFRMTYENAGNDKQQNIGTNQTVIFQTVNAAVELRNSSGTLMDAGTVQYYAGAWRPLGTTTNGAVYKELLPNNYSFRMTHEYVSNDKQQNIGTNSTVTFTTTACKVTVKDTNAQPIDNADIKYYAGAWRQFSTTMNGEAVRELLPANLSFRASYSGTQKDKVQNTAENSTVEFVFP
jgi:hypothetical protein